MARRIGDVKEFEFKTIGDNHNQGVSFFSWIKFGNGEEKIIAYDNVCCLVNIV